MERSLSARESNHKPHQILFAHNVFIDWDKKFNLGIAIIDEQHRGVVTTINSLHFAIQNHFINNSFSALVQMMNDYTRIHFEVEEAFLESIDYTQTKQHRELHAGLLEELTLTGRESLLNHNPREFLSFLKGWWTNHILTEDLIYRDYILYSQPR